MMQVSKIGTDIFICMERDISILGNLTEGLGIPIFENGLAILPIKSSAIELFDKAIKIDGLKIMRYLDHFYLLVPTDSPILRKQLFFQFFELIAEEYEIFIDSDRNKENISNLLWLIKYYIGSFEGAKILDFGCGTGFSLEIARYYEVDIVGFDPCPIMRQIAIRNGMNVWDELKFVDQPYNSIEATFSSYVFHFLTDDKNLRMIYNILKPGGVLVANFHKNLGRDLADKYLAKIGFESYILPNINAHEYHGTYVAYGKPK